MKHYAYPTKWPLNLLTSPLIFGLIIPVVFLDITVEIYHRICFPIYGIPYVKRSYYIIIDRHKLKYLDLFMKVSCAYCGYVNGVFHYVSKIAAETEKYWCGIMHANGKVLDHQEEYIPYNDKEAYRKYLADAKEKSGSNINARRQSTIFILTVIIISVFWYLVRINN